MFCYHAMDIWFGVSCSHFLVNLLHVACGLILFIAFIIIIILLTLFLPYEFSLFSHG